LLQRPLHRAWNIKIIINMVLPIALLKVSDAKIQVICRNVSADDTRPSMGKTYMALSSCHLVAVGHSRVEVVVQTEEHSEVPVVFAVLVDYALSISRHQRHETRCI
jgi:hypothetical protein